MTAQKLDGTATASAIKGELKERIAALRDRGVVPGLGTVLVGDDPGSRWYVNGKHKDCAEVGIESIRVDLPDTATQERDRGGGARPQRRSRRARATSSSCRCRAAATRTACWG